MKMKVIFSVLLCGLLCHASQAQLNNGATAPNWMMSDINGNSHTLYDYLNNGKAVVLDFSAAYCPSCWSYHSSQALKNFYNTRGPSAANYQAHVFFIELLPNNTTGCLYGPSGGGTPYQPCTGSGSAGNWVSGTPYPIIDNSSQNGPYNIASYPTILMVCPNKATYAIGTQTAAQLDNSMQTLCGITPGGGSASPLSYQVSNVTHNSCFGENKGNISITVSGGNAPYTYLWNNGATTANISNLSSNSYKVTITDNQNNTLISNPIAITQPNQIVTTATVLRYEKCGTAGSINLNTTGGTGNFSYLWSNNSNSQNLTNLTAAASYTVTVTDAAGCKIVKNAIAIDGYENQPLATISNALQLNCSVKNGVLNANVTPVGNNYTYLWSSNNGSILSQTNNTATVNTTGIYTYKVTDALSKCFSTVNSTVTENLTKPTIVFSPTAQNILNCNVKEITIAPSITDAGTNPTYSWSSQNGGLFVGAQNANSAKVKNAATFQLEVKNNLSECSTTSTTVITENLTKPTIVFSPTAQNILNCNLKEITIAPSITDAGTNPTYSWSSQNGGLFVGAQNANTAKVKNAATFQLEVKNNLSECKSISSIDIKEAQKPILVLNKISDIKCFGDQNAAISSSIGATLTPVSYGWSNNATTPNLEKQAAGNYTLTITDANGCTTSASLNITQPQALALKVTQITKATGTSSNGAIDITLSGGTKPYTFYWKKDGVAIGNNTQNLINLAAGTYELVVTDANNCTIKSEQVILQSTTAVEDIHGLLSYKFYPNPTYGILNISLQISDNQTITAQLMDIYGKIIDRKTAVSTAIFQETFDLSGLPTAVYLLQLQVGEKKIVEKILKH
jgi:SprB repeat/Secretion system C-terminal sorting domain